MSSDSKRKLLKYILLTKVFFTFFVWGLPFLLAPMAYFQRLGIPVPDDSLFIRLTGAIIIAFGVAYWYAYTDPVHNVAIIKAGVVDNGLVTLVTFIFMAFYNLRSVLMLASGLLTPYSSFHSYCLCRSQKQRRAELILAIDQLLFLSANARSMSLTR